MTDGTNHQPPSRSAARPRDRLAFRPLLLSYARSNDGVAAIQFALVATPFLAMLVAALQLFMLFFAQQTLETVAEEAGRMIMTGAVQKNNMTAASFKAAICQKTAPLIACNRLMIDVQVADSFSAAVTSAPTITYDQQGNVSNVWSWSPGSTQNIVVMRLICLWPVVNVPGLSLANQNGSTHLMMATAVFQNESMN